MMTTTRRREKSVGTQCVFTYLGTHLFNYSNLHREKARLHDSFLVYSWFKDCYIKNGTGNKYFSSEKRKGGEA